MASSSEEKLPTFRLGSLAELVVRLRFCWQEDRYGHRLEVVDGQQTILCLESLEGTGDQAWPTSPALQQLMQHQTGSDRPCTLLLGMAGNSHWSLSVEQDSTDSLLFDAACRVQKQPRWLGSSYRTCQPALRCEESVLGVPCGDHARQILLESVEGDTVQECQVTGDGVAIVASSAVDSLPTTVRWKYRLRLTQSADLRRSGTLS